MPCASCFSLFFPCERFEHMKHVFCNVREMAISTDGHPQQAVYHVVLQESISLHKYHHPFIFGILDLVILNLVSAEFVCHPLILVANNESFTFFNSCLCNKSHYLPIGANTISSFKPVVVCLL